MSKMQRRKGRIGQTELANLLRDRDWQVIETSAGQEVEDMVAIDPQGTAFSVECKHHKLINLPAFLKQAREQANKRKMSWLLACRIHEHPGNWLILRKGESAAIWKGK